MGNFQSGNLNEVQELIDSIRRSTGANEALTTTTFNIETATAKNKEEILQDLKLKFISEIIKSDSVDEFLEVIEEGNLNVFDAIGGLKLTPLHLAAYHNSDNVLKYLLKDPQVPINPLSKDKDTPLNLGLFGAESDAAAICVIRIFQQREDLNVFLKNKSHTFPLLIAVQKQFTEAAKLLLTSTGQRKSTQIPIVDQYETWDLVHVTKLAIITNQDALTDVIHRNLSINRRLQILDEILESKEANKTDLLADLVTLLEKTVASNSSSSNTRSRISGSPENTTRKLNSKTDAVVPDEEETDTVKKAQIKIPKPNKNGAGAVVDASGNVQLETGNIVRTLTPQFVKKSLPPGASQSDIDKIADKLALIHGIYGDKIYVEIYGEHVVTRMKPEATIFYAKGTVKILSDGSEGKIGSYVQVLSSHEKVKEIVGESNWIHGMEDACGKTGKIVRILRNSDILVQFPWGPRYYFKPAALLQSSNVKLKTQDGKGNWISIGSFVQIKKFLQELTEIQKKNNLPYDSHYSDLPWTFAVVKGIQLTSFSTAKTVQIISQERPYFVHVDCIELVDSVQDRNNQEVQVGDSVQVIKDEGEFKLVLGLNSESKYGKWAPEMLTILGRVGKVTELLSDRKVLLIKVELSGKSFYLNPRATEIFTGTVVAQQQLTPGAEAGPAGPGPAGRYMTGQEDIPTLITQEKKREENISQAVVATWEEIDRANLKCFEILGTGGFGCVVRAEWDQNGNKRIVAIKQINYGTENDAEPLAEVMAEAKIQFSLRHPNIVSLFGISLDQDLWIVMDFVDGTDLFTLLDPHDGEDTLYSMAQKIDLCLDMCNATAYIHQKGYIHCDIKPHNMMINQAGRLYLCDFGITQFMGVNNFMTMVTQYTNDIGGTVYYIPPECLQVNEISGQYKKPAFSADVWALGAVFYELFTRLHLYSHSMKFFNDKSANNDSIVKKRMEDLPDSVRAIVAQSLDFNRKARPTAQQLCEFFHELKFQ